MTSRPPIAPTDPTVSPRQPEAPPCADPAPARADPEYAPPAPDRDVPDDCPSEAPWPDDAPGPELPGESES